MLKVLIVCTGNICRSPIAHGLLADRARRLGDGWLEVRSAGTWGRDGNPATPEAVSSAAQIGIDIGAHRASRFTSELADRADLVVTMTVEQAYEVLEQSPQSRGKTFTLKELVGILGALPPAPSGTERDAVLQRIAEADRARTADYTPPADLDVVDPLGLSQTVYRAVANELEGLVDDLLRGLIGGRESAAAGG